MKTASQELHQSIPIKAKPSGLRLMGFKMVVSHGVKKFWIRPTLNTRWFGTNSRKHMFRQRSPSIVVMRLNRHRTSLQSHSSSLKPMQWRKGNATRNHPLGWPSARQATPKMSQWTNYANVTLTRNKLWIWAVHFNAWVWGFWRLAVKLRRSSCKVSESGFGIDRWLFIHVWEMIK